MTSAEISNRIFGDVTMLGVRAALGVVFIVHGFGKFGNDMFVGWMSSIGIPPEIAFIIAIGEFIPGILLVAGVLSRISASVIAVIMVAAIFIIKDITIFAGGDGYEFDLVLLASALLIIAVGPARVSIAHVVSRLPRFLH